MAGLLALGAAAVATDRYLPSAIAAREAASERAGWRALCTLSDKRLAQGDQEARKFLQPVYAYALMTARCGRRDIAMAHGLFRESIARRDFDPAFVWYYMALDEIGDTEGKRKLLVPTAAVVGIADARGTRRWTKGVPPGPYDAELTALSEKMAVAVQGTDPAVSLEIVRLLATREFETRDVEREILFRTMLEFRSLEPKEGEYWYARLVRTGRWPVGLPPTTAFLNYTAAARCGHTDAIRERAQFWLDVEILISEADRAHIVASVARLHARTSDEQALLDAVVAKSGISVERALSGALFPLAWLENPNLCRPLRLPRRSDSRP